MLTDYTIKCYRVNGGEYWEAHIEAKDDSGFDESLVIGVGPTKDDALEEAKETLKSLAWSADNCGKKRKIR